MILYLRDPKNSTNKLLDLINNFMKVERYKISIILYTNNEQAKKEITISFTIASKIKYVGINLTKEVKDLNNGNYEPQRKKF
jgi:hypothetical protein